MLEVGNGGMTKDEYIVHFSIWAISKVLLLSFTWRNESIHVLVGILQLMNKWFCTFRLLFSLAVTLEI